jgi:hypothetical protein
LVEPLILQLKITASEALQWEGVCTVEAGTTAQKMMTNIKAMVFISGFSSISHIVTNIFAAIMWRAFNVS